MNLLASEQVFASAFVTTFNLVLASIVTVALFDLQRELSLILLEKLPLFLQQVMCLARQGLFLFNCFAAVVAWQIFFLVVVSLFFNFRFHQPFSCLLHP